MRDVRQFTPAARFRLPAPIRRSIALGAMITYSTRRGSTGHLLLRSDFRCGGHSHRAASRTSPQDHRLARQVSLVRNFLLPLGVLLLLLVKASQIPAGEAPVRLLTTVFGFVVLELLLSGFNATVFEGAPKTVGAERYPPFSRRRTLRDDRGGSGRDLVFRLGVRVGGLFTALGVTPSSSA